MIARILTYYIPATILWGCILFFSVLLSHNAMLYFTHGGEYGILPEKITAREDLLWRISFYLHLPSGVLCLLLPIVSFSRFFIKTRIKLHSLIGKLYVWITLYIVCPTGMYLALFAKGGVITQIGFLLQGILLGWFTWSGSKSILNYKKQVHIDYMVRSYSVATAVLSFRILHILFFLLKVPYQDNYAISQWLGLAINILIGEVIIHYIHFKSNIQLKSNNYVQADETI